MSYVGKIIISCPRRGHIVKRVTGSSGVVVHKMFTFNPKTMGPACSIVSREIVKKAPRKKGR